MAKPNQLSEEQLEFKRRVDLVLSEYAPLADVPITRVMEKFGLKEVSEANRRASNHNLPVPFYRHGSQMSEYHCSAQDLAEYIAAKQMTAIAEFRQITNANQRYHYPL